MGNSKPFYQSNHMPRITFEPLHHSVVSRIMGKSIGVDENNTFQFKFLSST